MLTTVNNLERNGKIQDSPIVELFYEAAANDLSGTFRLASDALKSAVYFADGKIVFAQTNLRAARLAVKLVENKFIGHADLAGFQDLPDVELAAKLLENNKISVAALETCQTALTIEIIRAALSRTHGEWWFNPLVRAREDLRRTVDLQNLIVAEARSLPFEIIEKRFGGNPLESVSASLSPTEATFNLSSEEAFALSRIEGVVNVADLPATTGLPEQTVKHAVYVLWLGNLVRRFNHPQVFDQTTIRQFQTARVHLRQTAAVSDAENSTGKLSQTAADSILQTEQSAPETLEDYLARVESARNHYETLDLTQATAANEVKNSYFKFAKQFHPDKFHQTVGSELHTRLQHSFTRISAAYEALKDQKSRDLYDFKLKKEGGAQSPENTAAYKPEVAFSQGMDALSAGDFAQAAAFLNRAVQLDGNNAEYHARLGQALAVNPKFRHKAEAEFQTALKLDEKNPQWRLLAAEFYVLVGLNKRAETELSRLLIHDPNYPAALALLGKIK